MSRTMLTASVAALCLLQVGILNANAADEGIETVIVTAQKVEQDIQRTPVSVSAFSARDLEKSHIESLTDIALRTPGLSGVNPGPTNTNLSIRGIGSAEGVAQNAGGDPSVVLMMDGVYAGRGGLADIDAYNLERIEVLRGPQGTLYGKDAAGGIVNFISAKPNDQQSIRASATIGNYNRIDVNGQVNIPLTENLFFAGGASSKNRSGYEYNETTGNRVNDQHISTVQGQLLYQPSETLEFLLAADYTHQDQKGNPRHNNCTAMIPDTANPGQLVVNPSCAGINPDPRVVDAYSDGYIRRDLATVRGEVHWTTPIGTVTSVTAFRDVRLGYFTPFFSNPINPPTQIESTEIDSEKDKQVSEELRLNFNALEDRLTGVAGLYFLHEDNNRLETLVQQFALPSISGTAIYPQSVSARSIAVFGQADYKVFDTLTATLGARMTWETKSGHFIGQLVDGIGPPPLSENYDVRASKSWSALTPHAALNWQVTDDAMVYFSASRGFKSGGYQGIAGSRLGAQTPYDPEFDWNYELGAKTQWLENKLQLNGAIFQTNYSDLQISQLIPLCCVVVGNAAEARIRGAELSFVALPFPGWQLDGNYSYLDAQYVGCASSASICVVGNSLSVAPKNKANLGAQYTTELPIGVLTARFDYLYTSKVFFEPSNDPNQSQPGYSMIDSRIAISSLDDHWELAVWGKNLTNTLVATYFTAYPPNHQILTPYAPPRTFGVTLTFKS